MYTNLTKFLLFVVLLFTQPSWAEQTLRYSVASSWNMPYANFYNNKIIDGIMYDIAIAIGKQLHMPITFVVLPRKRIDYAAHTGDIDIRCYLSPRWVDSPDQYVWSGQLFEITDVVFGRSEISNPTDIQNIPDGSLISVVLGYEYPELNVYFNSGKLKRDDTTDQEKVNRKITADLTPYGVSESMALNWYERVIPEHGHSNWRLVFSTHDFQCGIPKSGRINSSKIIKALLYMKSHNEFETILQKYK